MENDTFLNNPNIYRIGEDIMVGGIVTLGMAIAYYWDEWQMVTSFWGRLW